MALLNDLEAAATKALTAGVTAARAQGAALAGDFETLVKPNLDAIVVQVAAITQDRIDGAIGDDQARDDLSSQFGRVRTEALAMVELSELALQTIVNAVLAALKGAINAAVGVALL
jgi:hypothetical protein